MALARLIEEARSQDLRAFPDQVEVTQRLILPALPELLAAVSRARAKTDLAFRRQINAKALAELPNASGDSNLGIYPVGFCTQIRDSVHSQLVDEAIVQSLRSAGAIFKKVYLILRDRYFQNALQLGNLYIDAANDTVFVEKPQVECLPISELEYTNLESWENVVAVAEKYYECRAYPNLYFPLLAPVVPFLSIRDNGRLDLLHFQNWFFLKDLGDDFKRLRAVFSSRSELMKRKLPKSCAAELRRKVGGNDFHIFPFEFRPCSPQEALAQAEGVATAAREPAQEGLIFQLLNLVPKAAQKLRSLNIRG